MRCNKIMPVSRLSRFFSRQTMRAARKVRLPRVKKGPLSARRAHWGGAKRSRVSISRNMHCFRRYCADARVNCTGTTESFAIQYLFQNVVNPNDFADLYDRYMITCVVHKFRLVNNPDAASTHNFTAHTDNSTNWFPKLWYCPDYDDNNTETLQELQQRAKVKCMVLRPNQQYTVVVRPAVTVQAYRTLTTTGYSPKWKQWIDMGQRDVPHYGLKCVIDTSAQDPTDTRPFIVEYTTQMFFKCKDVR